MRNTRLLIASLCLLTSILLSLPWLVPYCGFVSLFAFIPLLCADRLVPAGEVKHFWLFHYSTFVIWNALTTFWVCNATVGGGLFAIFANALQMSLIWGLFRLSKRKLGSFLPYIFLAALWIAWERWYLTGAQISWPWLVLGNAFATSVRDIQWYSITGTLGGSLWIWLSNLSIFGLMVSVSDGSLFRWRAKARVSFLVFTVLAVFGPLAASTAMYSAYEEKSEGQVEVVIGQPNFDPYQKFTSMSQAQQTRALLERFDEKLIPADSTSSLLFLAPETFTSGIVTGDVGQSPTFRTFQNFLEGYPESTLIFGASTYDIVTTRSAPTPLAYEWGENWLVSHNSALSTDSSGRCEIAHKGKLVVGTELTPYPAVFIPLEKLVCRVFGLRGPLIGRCVPQQKPDILHHKDIPVGCAVCYESVFGEYACEYVRKGAELLTVITNDAWWGDTPGYRQHMSYSRLRAVELRRDIARCGNTGISCFINQRGDVVEQGPWWEETALRGRVNLNSELTPFALYGDVVGRCSVLVVLLLLALLAVRSFVRR